jgi:peptide/nickel transport system permease protein
MLDQTGEAVLVKEQSPWLSAPGQISKTILNFCRRKPLGAIGGSVVLVLAIVALVAPVLAPYGDREIIREETGKVPVYHTPSIDYLLGTDHVGRDTLSRIMYGARISLYVGGMSVAIGITGFFLLGVFSAYAGGKVDLVIQRLIDAKMALPGLVIALAIVAALGSSLNNVILAIIIGLAPAVVRTVRSQVLSLKEMDYVLAARAVGASPARIMLRHIAPNCFATYLILATYYLGFAIILEASLSFLGVGSPPDVPSWGGMLTMASQAHIKTGPYTAIFPGLAIFVVVLGFNLLGDALRDVFDPRLRGTGS